MITPCPRCHGFGWFWVYPSRDEDGRYLTSPPDTMDHGDDPSHDEPCECASRPVTDPYRPPVWRPKPARKLPPRKRRVLATNYWGLDRERPVTSVEAVTESQP